MNYLIKGGEFNNKGAEAMTFVAISHIMEADSQAKIFIIDYGTYQPYEFYADVEMVYFPQFIINSMLRRHSFNDAIIRLKDIIKYFLPNKKSAMGRYGKLKKILRSIDVMIDISGFAASSQWGDNKTLEYCDWIRLIKHHGGKIYLMPQSFGPFNYRRRNTFEYLKETLPLCDGIFVREKKGYEELKKCGIDKAILSPDSVLLEKNFCPSSVIRNFDDFEEKTEVKTGNSIGIVPNYRLIDRGNMSEDKLLEFYCGCIDHSRTAFFYLISHAGEDLELCMKIKQKYLDDDRVILIDHVLPSFIYEDLVSKLNFIIASRYHSIIHAYKETTPAVILGWSEKYNDVAAIFSQKQYIIDLTDIDRAIGIFNNMCIDFSKERRVIGKKLDIIQAKDCYSFLTEK